jgi:hypothetical protein
LEPSLNLSRSIDSGNTKNLVRNEQRHRRHGGGSDRVGGAFPLGIFVVDLCDGISGFAKGNQHSFGEVDTFFVTFRDLVPRRTMPRTRMINESGFDGTCYDDKAVFWHPGSPPALRLSISVRVGNVRFWPHNGIKSDIAPCPFCTKSNVGLIRSRLRSSISLHPAKLLRAVAKTDFRRVDVSL